MARTRNNRVVLQPPRIKGFHPIGNYRLEMETTNIFLEEYESIRLLDYDALSQVEAAQIMQVSRPTLTRIYQSARKKIAKALVEGTLITIEGGHAIFSEAWNDCPECHCRFNISGGNSCPLCHRGGSSLMALPMDHPGEEATIHPAFAKAPYLMLVDNKSKTSIIENNLINQPQTGIKVVEMIHKLGVTTIVAYEIGIPVQHKAQELGINLVLLPHNLQRIKELLKLINFNNESI